MVNYPGISWISLGHSFDDFQFQPHFPSHGRADGRLRHYGTGTRFGRLGRGRRVCRESDGAAPPDADESDTAGGHADDERFAD